MMPCLRPIAVPELRITKEHHWKYVPRRKQRNGNDDDTGRRPADGKVEAFAFLPMTRTAALISLKPSIERHLRVVDRLPISINDNSIRSQIKFTG